MSYTQARFPNDPTQFPTPPHWLVWCADRLNGWGGRAAEHAAVASITGVPVGQVRHLPTLEKAKQYVNPGRRYSQGGQFWCTWAIYEWVDGEYVLRYSGKEGELRGDHPLFQPKPRAKRTRKPRKPSEIDQAIESIRRAAS